MLKFFKSPVIGLLILALIGYAIYKSVKQPDQSDEQQESGGVVGGIPKLKYTAREKGFFEFTPYQWFGYDIRNLFNR